MKPHLVTIASLVFLAPFLVSGQYDPNWESIDSRPLPQWFDDGKVGIFIHWGLYSVPSYINEWFWWSWLGDNSEAHDNYMKQNFKPGFAYEVKK